MSDTIRLYERLYKDTMILRVGLRQQHFLF